ncbi:uncharacterized protein BP01DRAFT_410950, partial [Aspergillus saccharolyticus JOP 1030-1]
MPPYIPGFQFTARQHRPPNDYGMKTMRLRVSDVLRVGDGWAAQLILVQEIKTTGFEVEMGPKLLAKLFDAKYLQPPFQRIDYARKQYKRECAAYRHLRLNHLQEYIPEFFGSWSTRIVDSRGQERSVRMILTEYIRGHDMEHLRPSDFTTRERKEIMRQALAAETKFYACNFRHQDFFPRNVMVTPALEIVIIDFGLASTHRSPSDVYSSRDTDLLEGRYISPILRWWRSDDQIKRDPWMVSGWITWDWNQWLVDTWRSDIPDITADMLKWVVPSERNRSFFQRLFRDDRREPRSVPPSSHTQTIVRQSFRYDTVELEWLHDPGRCSRCSCCDGRH